MLRAKKKFDSTKLGAIIGFVIPIIAFYIILKVVYPFEFMDKSLHNIWLHVVAPRILSLGAIPNLGIFFLFIYTNRLRSARGVLGATVVYTVIVFILKLIV
jgi:hypothetical protein